MLKQHLSTYRNTTFVAFATNCNLIEVAMTDACTEFVDPRVKRTRELLQQALGKLLETTEFEKISVQDITDEATVNRATFYAHYPDKFALFECMVASRFHQLLADRGVTFNGT